MRQYRAKEHDAVLLGHKQCREIDDVEFSEEIRVVFDIHPDKVDLREGDLEPMERCSIGIARATPRGA